MPARSKEAANTTDREIVISRVFDAPREMVFDAWLDPVGARRWLFATPHGEMIKVKIDARVGGGFTVVEKRGDVLAEHFGEYLEIRRPLRLVFSFASGREQKQKPSLVTVEFKAVPRGCEVTLTHRISEEWAEYFDRVREGWTNMLEGLATMLTDREIVLSRVFDAPRELVWKAWTDQEHVDQWWGPNGFRNATSAMDVRPGGEWRYVMHGPNGVDYPNRIVYEQIVKPERLVYTHDSGQDNDPHAFHVTVTFEDQGGKTKVTMQGVFATAEQRAYVVKEFHAIEGGNQTLARLAEYLRELQHRDRQVRRR